MKHEHQTEQSNEVRERIQLWRRLADIVARAEERKRLARTALKNLPPGRYGTVTVAQVKGTVVKEHLRRAHFRVLRAGKKRKHRANH